MSEVVNIPQLRFPEFETDWEKEKLKNVSTYFNGGSFENDVQVEGRYELVTLKSINMSGSLVHSKRFIEIEVSTLSKNTLVMILSEQSPGLLGMTALIPIDNKYVLNQRVAEIRPNDNVDSYFLSMSINRNQRYFGKHGAGTKVQNLSKPNVENYEFLCPTKPEQQKIAAFLTAVDNKIEQLSKKQELLGEYKKGLMQQIFSQAIRFQADDGSTFPDWEEQKVGSFMVERNKKSPKSEAYPLMSFVARKGVTEKGERYNREFLVNDEGGKKYKQTEYGDFIYSSNNLETGSIGLNKYGAATISPVYSIFQITDTCNYEFVSSFLVTKSFIHKMVRFRQGVVYGQWRIHESDFLKIQVKLPSLEEQTKIANFLSSIDNKIEQVGKQLDESKQFKKALLQQMFV